ncbi:MAG: D-ribose pyranase [Micromonosporaceae bacterium]
MRSDGLWHPRLAELIVEMAHTDTLVVADAGLPTPSGVERIDLLWSRGQPPFLPVVRAILAELVVEQATVAEEMKDPGLLDFVETSLADIPVTRVSHEQFKQRCREARAVVRTGEDTPYANVILHAGVPFGEE